jgi:hypothetical protein
VVKVSDHDFQLESMVWNWKIEWLYEVNNANKTNTYSNELGTKSGKATTKLQA